MFRVALKEEVREVGKYRKFVKAFCPSTDVIDETIGPVFEVDKMMTEGHKVPQSGKVLFCHDRDEPALPSV